MCVCVWVSERLRQFILLHVSASYVSVSFDYTDSLLLLLLLLLYIVIAANAIAWFMNKFKLCLLVQYVNERVPRTRVISIET